MITTESQREEIRGWVREWRKIRRMARKASGSPVVASVADTPNASSLVVADASTGRIGPSVPPACTPGLGRPSTGPFRGVSSIRGRFRVQIAIGNGRNKHLGTYDSEVQAAMAWDRAAVEMRGDKAVLNFPRG